RWTVMFCVQQLNAASEIGKGALDVLRITFTIQWSAVHSRRAISRKAITQDGDEVRLARQSRHEIRSIWNQMPRAGFFLLPPMPSICIWRRILAQGTRRGVMGKSAIRHGAAPLR